LKSDALIQQINKSTIMPKSNRVRRHVPAAASLAGPGTVRGHIMPTNTFENTGVMRLCLNDEDFALMQCGTPKWALPFRKTFYNRTFKLRHTSTKWPQFGARHVKFAAEVMGLVWKSKSSRFQLEGRSSNRRHHGLTGPMNASELELLKGLAIRVMTGLSKHRLLNKDGETRFEYFITDIQQRIDRRRGPAAAAQGRLPIIVVQDLVPSAPGPVTVPVPVQAPSQAAAVVSAKSSPINLTARAELDSDELDDNSTMSFSELILCLDRDIPMEALRRAAANLPAAESEPLQCHVQLPDSQSCNTSPWHTSFLQDKLLVNHAPIVIDLTDE
jgi:hypothetical protein